MSEGGWLERVQELQKEEDVAGRKKAYECTNMVAVGFAVLQVRGSEGGHEGV